MRLAWWWFALAACGSEPEAVAPAAESPKPVAKVSPPPVDAQAPRPPDPVVDPAEALPPADDPWNQAPRPRDNPADGVPDELKSWLPASTAAAWQGTWTAHLPPSGFIPDAAAAGEPVALRVEKRGATISDGAVDYTADFEIVSPCAAAITPTSSSGLAVAGDILKQQDPRVLFKLFDRISLRFAVLRGRMMVGAGAVGVRRGAQAFVCSDGPTESFLLDANGRCSSPQYKVSCVWRTPTTLVIRCERCWTQSLVLVADGNALVSADFRRNARPLVKAKDFAAAKQWAAKQRAR